MQSMKQTALTELLYWKKALLTRGGCVIMSPLFLWLITAVYASGKPCYKAAGVYTSHTHGLFGDHIGWKRAREKTYKWKQRSNSLFFWEWNQ